MGGGAFPCEFRGSKDNRRFGMECGAGAQLVARAKSRGARRPPFPPRGDRHAVFAWLTEGAPRWLQEAAASGTEGDWPEWVTFQHAGFRAGRARQWWCMGIRVQIWSQRLD